MATLKMFQLSLDGNVQAYKVLSERFGAMAPERKEILHRKAPQDDLSDLTDADLKAMIKEKERHLGVIDVTKGKKEA